MKKNDIVEIEITGTTDEGMGVGRANGIAVFVPYALPGEIIRAIIIKVAKSYLVGKLLDVVKPSPNRVKSECEFFYKCGGCQFWNVQYETELEYKRQLVEDCIKRIGNIDVEVPQVLGGRDCKGYRNKGQFPVSIDGIGIYAAKSHRVIDVDRCIIQDETNPHVLACVREWMKKYNIEAYCEETDTGVIRHIYTRNGCGGLMVCIVTRTEELLHSEELVKALHDVLGEKISGILQNVNKAKTNVVLGKTFKTLWGDDYLIDNIGEYKFKISPLSFYQVNNAQTVVLYNKAMEYAGLTGKETLWDMYCGIGTIGQYMSKGAAKIVGVEIVEDAVRNARENARFNGIENAQYFCGAAEEVAPKLLEKGLKPDVVVLDPPRKGCDIKLLETVASVAPQRIVYVSCKPSTLARDLKILDSYGYNTIKVQPVDLFPRTSHVECCVLLCKA